MEKRLENLRKNVLDLIFQKNGIYYRKKKYGFLQGKVMRFCADS